MELGTRAWCVKPTLDGGCGGHFHWNEEKGRWYRHATSKRARIEPAVKPPKVKEVAA